jgi:hypothetical protein
MTALRIYIWELEVSGLTRAGVSGSRKVKTTQKNKKIKKFHVLKDLDAWVKRSGSFSCSLF